MKFQRAHPSLHEKCRVEEYRIAQLMFLKLTGNFNIHVFSDVYLSQL